MGRNWVREWWHGGHPWVWLNAGAVAVSLLMVAGLLGLITAKGLGHFWIRDVASFQYQGQKWYGQWVERESVSRERLEEAGISLPGDALKVDRVLVKLGNRDTLGHDYVWLIEPEISSLEYPRDVALVERSEWGNLYGRIVGVESYGTPRPLEELPQLWQRARQIAGDIHEAEVHEIGSLNYQLERLDYQRKKAQLGGLLDAGLQLSLAEQKAELEAHYQQAQQSLAALYLQAERDVMLVEDSQGAVQRVPLARVVKYYFPNQLDVIDKLKIYFQRVGDFLYGDPREANMEGGVFPAIFGTVVMVILMSVLVMPLGVVAALYMSEYARQGMLIRIIRVAVNNLAGVPSIVYGVFGLGFFVYFIGGGIDRLFFPAAAPAPVFGTGGLLWSSLTLALLTLPVVIVATEEGLKRIPMSVREGSLALGATQAETLWRTVIPMASPAMLTGLILAVARAAGEVAPLMLVGVVKFAPELPIDGDFPYLHVDRKLMHLGFHIYDVGFQSPNVEAARPLVYATALLLVLVILVLNFSAILIRNRLREKYRALEH